MGHNRLQVDHRERGGLYREVRGDAIPKKVPVAGFRIMRRHPASPPEAGDLGTSNHSSPAADHCFLPLSCLWEAVYYTF